MRFFINGKNFRVKQLVFAWTQGRPPVNNYINNICKNKKCICADHLYDSFYTEHKKNRIEKSKKSQEIANESRKRFKKELIQEQPEQFITSERKIDLLEEKRRILKFPKCIAQPKIENHSMLRKYMDAGMESDIEESGSSLHALTNSP